LEQVRKEVSDKAKVPEEFQRRLAATICTKFLPMFKASGEEVGYVSIQANPLLDEDADVIITEGHLNRTVAPNVCCKIPLVPAGLKAMETLIPEGIPINATEIFAISQGVVLGELYERLVPKNEKGPKLWYSHIAGIYDDYIKNYVMEKELDIPRDIVNQGGLAVSKKLYHLVKERGYRMSYIGGGARGSHHFTELVGGDVNLTINWKGTADLLLESDPDVVWRIFNPVPDYVISVLSDKIPAFKAGIELDGLAVGDFEEFGPVQLFKSSFVKSWEKVQSLV
jgi:transaldolase